MRKNKWFKMGAGLTAALMLCGSVSVVAFADEADVAAPAAEETVAEEVVTEEVADIGEIVIEGVGDAADSDVAPEQEIRRIPSEDEEEEVEIKKLAIPRRSAAQLANKARKAGDTPDIVRDSITKVTLFDYSDIIAGEDDEEEDNE